MAAWAEARGFKTAIIERTFGPTFRVDRAEPSVALIGVDNALARQSVEEVGFLRIIEAGLGHGPDDFLGIDLHTFPASRTARATWPEIGASDPDIAKPAYRALLEATGDRCGMVRLAARSIGAPFVGAAAAALVVSELLRLGVGGPANEVVSCHLRDPEACLVVPSQNLGPYNAGSIPVAA